MQTFAFTCLGIVSVQTSVMMGTLWYMAATGKRPGWVNRMLGDAPGEAE